MTEATGLATITLNNYKEDKDIKESQETGMTNIISREIILY